MYFSFALQKMVNKTQIVQFMREKEYPPLYADGFQDIVEKDLHKVFIAPFTKGIEHRTDLLLNFVQFLKQFKRLGLSAEIWIDGSFATYAPDPGDIDMVFYFDETALKAMSDKNRQLFQKLFQNRKFIKNLYQLEVFCGTKDSEEDYAQWRKNFGTGYDNLTPKGIFRLFYK
jgi:hypothetical protein